MQGVLESISHPVNKKALSDEVCIQHHSGCACFQHRRCVVIPARGNAPGKQTNRPLKPEGLFHHAITSCLNPAMARAFSPERRRDKLSQGIAPGWYGFTPSACQASIQGIPQVSLSFPACVACQTRKYPIKNEVKVFYARSGYLRISHEGSCLASLASIPLS